MVTLPCLLQKMAAFVYHAIYVYLVFIVENEMGAVSQMYTLRDVIRASVQCDIQLSLILQFRGEV